MLLIITIIFTLLVLELGIRLFVHVSDNMWQSDDILGKKYIPNKEGWVYSSEYSNKIKINNEGFNDKNYNVSNPDNHYRILIIGDSLTASVHVPLNETFQELLEQNLSDKQVDVIALGAGGYGTANEYFLMKDYGLKYKPNLTIMMFFAGNDIRNNAYALEKDINKPYFIINDTGLAYVPFKPYTQPLWKRVLMDNSKLANYIFILTQRLQSSSKDFPKDYFVYAQNYNQTWIDSWGVTLSLISDMKKMAENNGSKFLLVSIPSKEQVYPSIWNDITTQYPDMNNYQWNLKKPDFMVKTYCQIKNINCLFLYDTFQNVSISDGIYFPVDGHFNITGHKIVSQVLSNEVKQ